ncbi:acyl-CoA N-acyltransferase [Lipomyces oligophaga]|uniref:acyl-CoA N-acyltransferase n=1 Tax=Lipomyces oligophaga TaxID=45792 RepID=UPI0034CED82D
MGSIESNTLLFSSEFIDPSVADSLAPDYALRALKPADYSAGFLQVLAGLTTVGTISAETFNRHFEFLLSRPGEYFVLVIENLLTGKIVATGTLLVERKFIHECGRVGHIEDIAVDTNERGKKLGLKIIHALDYIGQKTGCYKNILDCSPHNEQFYVKCGYSNDGFEMVKRF